MAHRREELTLHPPQAMRLGHVLDDDDEAVGLAIPGEEAGVRSALQRFYFFRPVLYRPSNLARYARHPGLAAGMVVMYGVLTGVAAAELVKGRVRARRAPDPHADQGPVPGDERSAP